MFLRDDVFTSQLGWAAMASTIMEEMVVSEVPVTTATYDAAIKVKQVCF